jgi:hypothetical protein
MGRELARLSGGDSPDAIALPLTKLQPIRWHLLKRKLAPPMALWGYRRADRREIR